MTRDYYTGSEVFKILLLCWRAVVGFSLKQIYSFGNEKIPWGRAHSGESVFFNLRTNILPVLYKMFIYNSGVCVFVNKCEIEVVL
jgi:hypothetical protein